MTQLHKIALTCGAAVMLLGAAPAPEPYHLLNSTTLGGDSFWDIITLDTANHHLFITHGSHVLVLNSDSYAVVADIPDTPGVHGVAVAEGKGFITVGGNNTVVMFDPVTLKVAGTLAVGTRPDGILYEPASHRVFTFNAGSKDATVIDARAGTIVGTVPLGGKPEFAVGDGKGRIYNNIEDTSEIVEIDAKTMTVLKRWPLAPCSEPSGLAIDVKHQRLFAACDNAIMTAVSTSTGKVVATVPTGRGADGAGFNPQTNDVLIPNGEGKLSVIHEQSADHYALVSNVPTQFGARTMEFDPASQRIFTVTADLTSDPSLRPPYRITPGSFRLLVYGP